MGLNNVAGNILSFLDRAGLLAVNAFSRGWFLDILGLVILSKWLECLNQPLQFTDFYMKNVISTLLFLASIVNVHSQNIEFKFRTICSSTHKTIPFVQVCIKNSTIGFCTNEDGFGRLILTQDESRIKLNDSLIFQALSYNKEIRTLSMLDPDITNTIQLSPKPITLSEFQYEVPKKTKTIKLGNPRKDYLQKVLPISNYGTIGWMIGRYIPNKTQSNPFIKSVSFYITSWGSYTAPFRLRIFTVNDSFYPDEELLNKNVILNAKKPNRWVETDISKFGLSLPDSGIIVCMEWIWTGDHHYYKSTFSEDSFYGPTLGFTTSDIDFYRKGKYDMELIWYKNEKNENKTFNDPSIFIKVNKPKKRKTKPSHNSASF
jgi:hypothetical protein